LSIAAAEAKLRARSLAIEEPLDTEEHFASTEHPFAPTSSWWSIGVYVLDSCMALTAIVE
jgi:hypothetical protein